MRWIALSRSDRGRLSRCTSPITGTALLAATAPPTMIGATAKPLRASLPAKAKEGVKIGCDDL
jgi:hypothetical protein